MLLSLLVLSPPRPRPPPCTAARCSHMRTSSRQPRSQSAVRPLTFSSTDCECLMPTASADVIADESPTRRSTTRPSSSSSPPGLSGRLTPDHHHLVLRAARDGLPTGSHAQQHK
eukprot:764653-Hanusia_phi.AAC.2